MLTNRTNMTQETTHATLHAMQQELQLLACELSLDEAALLFQELADWAYAQYEVCVYKADIAEPSNEEDHD